RLTADDVHERVSDRTEATAEVARELLSAESGGGLQNSVVRPAVVLVEELNVVVSHGGGGRSPYGNLTLPWPFRWELRHAKLRPGAVTNDSALSGPLQGRVLTELPQSRMGRPLQLP